MNRIFSCVVLLSVVGAASAQTAYASYVDPAVNILRDAVLTLKGAYVMMPPKAVLNDVDEIHWNMQGTKLIAVSHSQKPEIEAALKDLAQVAPPSVERYLAVVDPKTMSATWISGIEGPLADVDVRWPAAGDFCVVEGRPVGRGDAPPHAVYIVDLAAAKARAIPLDDPYDDVFLEEFSNGRKLMLIFRRANNAPAIPVVLDSKGNPTPTLPGLEKAMQQGWFLVDWSPRLGLILVKSEGMASAVLLPSGEIQPLDRATFLEDLKLRRTPPEVAPVHLQLSEKTAKQGREAWLLARPDTGPQPSALVCSLTETVALSPRFDAVAYTSQRMLWIRRLEFIDAETAVLLQQEAFLREMMSRAKQIGTALNIYATDYDDCFPTGDPVTSLMPYCKNDDLFPGFVFTFKPGQNMNDINGANEYEIGHFQLPGGRVVTYADSSVRWVPNK